MFALRNHHTTVATEILAGLTTFAAMAYILAVNPAILSITGMDAAALVTATALSAAIGSVLMGLLTNYPIALAPGMGLNAFFTFTICGQMEVPWQGALAMVFWNGVFFLALSLTALREKIVRAIPDALKTGIQAGIGLFIAVVGLKNLGIFGDPAPGFFALRPGTWSASLLPPILLATGGILLALILMRFRVAGALLLAIGAVTVAGFFVLSGGEPVTPSPAAVVAAPASLAPLFLEIDWWYPFRHWETAWIAVLTLVFVDLFDSIGTLIGVSRQANLVDAEGQLPRMRSALAADAASTAIGACLGTSPVTSYIESATGVQAGGRTGLITLVVAACFLVAMFFHPVIAIIPAAAVAPALIIVGALMMRGLGHLDWRDLRATIPALAIVILIPLNFQIAEGIAAGCVLYTLVMFLTGQWKRVHPVLAVLSVLFAIKLGFDIAR